ncbi:hypothetical protein NZ698_14920 [Chryseobacterium sp. PBS4-4]|uniref:RNA polymerase sigma-70 region 2 domain-containing protein n=1 Tax=Chryseobacterium edaphi TaxID=2976532 RepID=A0ABT2W8E9_9FLAO|nr:hypothetical protein [Chryseobacterium edaphi]MCU7618491.1 hypothetical protein [Chryseobacterium edaphi]
MKKIVSEEDLFLWVRQNNRKGFDYLYDQHSCFLYGIAIKAVGSQQYADEVVAMVFSKIWNSIRSDKTQSIPLKLWMIQVLFCTIKEFLDSKGIAYVFSINQFPEFGFELTEKNL